MSNNHPRAIVIAVTRPLDFAFISCPHMASCLINESFFKYWLPNIFFIYLLVISLSLWWYSSIVNHQFLSVRTTTECMQINNTIDKSHKIKNQPVTLLQNFLSVNSPWQQIENKKLSRENFQSFSFLFFSPSQTLQPLTRLSTPLFQSSFSSC